MNSRMVTLAGLIGLLSSLHAESAPLRGDAIRLQGTWRVATINGKPVDEGTDLTFIFSVNDLRAAEGGVPGLSQILSERKSSSYRFGELDSRRFRVVSGGEIDPVFQGLDHLAQFGLVRGVGVNCRVKYGPP
jgi:hypothetical protein